MAALPLVFAVFAFVCFVLASIPIAAPYWQRLVSAGLAFWVFVHVLGYAGFR